MKTMKRHTRKNRLLLLGTLFIAFSLFGLAIQNSEASAQTSSFHPTFPLLDEDRVNVLESGKPVSTMETCGACHDTEFIAGHSFHNTLGLDDFGEPGDAPGGRSWDTSPGLFGRWNPITYRYLSPEGDQRLDLSTAEWVQLFGSRHAGGGPAETSRDGLALTALSSSLNDPETSILNSLNGRVEKWDWQESGTVEMNCFLCHYENSNNTARISALENGQFGWANTATLLGTGIVSQTGDGFAWNSEAFTENGNLAAEFVNLQGPTNQACGQCHGLVQMDPQTPLTLTGCQSDQSWTTSTTGQIISPQRLSASGMNLAGKEDLSRSWDIHAERLVGCTDCHFSLNNPVYFDKAAGDSPDHLEFDPRRLDFGDYLLQPSHDFARGQSAAGADSPELRATMRRCESCHDAEQTHNWLPYQDRHMEALNCETCHIPKIYAPAYQQVDWTVITPESTSASQCRGVEGEPASPGSLVTGYRPIILLREETDGAQKFSPYNLVTSWFWVYGDPSRPVRRIDLESVYLDGSAYRPDVIAAFDEDGDQRLDSVELVIDTPAKKDFITARLEDLGLENPRILAEVQPYSINHDVANGDWATRDCQSCHGEESQLTQPVLLSGRIPGGVLPEFVQDTNVVNSGGFTVAGDGALYFQPAPEDEGLYIIGQDTVEWVDWFGVIAFLGTLGGVTLHGGLRFYTSLRRPKDEVETEKVYMYTLYERLWHWLQTFVILLLVFTGLIIHKPSMFGAFSFRYVILVHNLLAAILLANAFLALFYNLVSGDIKRFIPEPHGFFNQAIRQALYYLRGIFQGAEHPFEKSADARLNPLQKVTYLAILNVLLPLQVLTGALMWGAQRRPEIASRLGGLPFLGPFHTLIAWLFAAFIVLHVYLTTTGHTPLAGIKSMMDGWDHIEVHPQHLEESA